jgi:hypothetical protein
MNKSVFWLLMLSMLPMCKTAQPPMPGYEVETAIFSRPVVGEPSYQPEVALEGSTESSSKTLRVNIGESSVQISIYQRGIGPTFVNMHENENTSVQAALKVIDERGGRLMQLQHSGERHVKFRLQGKMFEFDPNRIYTEHGAQETLSTWGPYSLAARQEAMNLASSIVQLLDGSLVVALHNNTDNNYSARSYLGDLKNDAAEVFLHPKNDDDDFFFVTKSEQFEFFKSKGFNVVLQDNRSVTDDGSLSVYCGLKNIPYINVEAEHGHLEEQVEMIRAVYAFLEN